MRPRETSPGTVQGGTQFVVSWHVSIYSTPGYHYVTQNGAPITVGLQFKKFRGPALQSSIYCSV